MSLRDELLEDATILGEGGFTLDRRRAMEKLSRFQLEDPHRYVLELVAAAICAGSQEITIRNDADDLELSWDGDHPSEAEVDALFDHIFYRGEDRRQRMLQHLAQGLYGALGLQPRWIRLERPGLSLDFTDPLAVGRVPNDRGAGVFVHVRERFSWKVFVEAVSPFDEAYEAKLIRARASMSPVPITINGERITGQAVAAPTDRPVLRQPDALLWLAEPQEPADARLGGGVLVVRDGISVQVEHIDSGPLKLVGWLDAPSVLLNASRSGIVEDDAHAAAIARLWEALEALLLEMVSAEVRPATVEPALLALLKARPRSAGRFADVPLFIDVLGRRWSIAALRESASLWYTSDPTLVVDDFAEPLWLSMAGLRARGHHPHDEVRREQWPVLRSLMGKRLRNGSSRLRKIQQGRQRRLALAREAERSLGADMLMVQPVTGEHGVTGEIGLPKQPGSPEIHATMLVEGLPIASVVLPWRCRMVARVTAPDLEADVAFEEVLDTPGRRAIRPAVLAAAEALLLAAAAQAPDHPSVLPGLQRTVLVRARQHGADLDGWLKELPPALVRAPLFQTLSGAPRTMAELVGKKVACFAAEEHARLLAIEPPLPPSVTEDVVLASLEERKVLRRLVGRGLSNQTRTILDTAHARQRRSQPPVRPMLQVSVDHRFVIKEEGLTGVVGIQRASADPTVHIIHQGVSLGHHPLDIPLPGLVASVAWADAVPDTAWTGLRKKRQLRQLSGRLRPIVLQLVRTAMRGGQEADTMPPWLLSAMMTPLDRSLLDEPWFRTVSGELRSVRALKAGRRVSFVREDPGQDMPGLGDAVILSKDAEQILRKHLGKRKLKDASGRVKELRDAWERFRARKIEPLRLPPDVRYLATRELDEGELRGVLGVRLDKSLTPLIRIRCLHTQRLLDISFAPHFLVIDAIVWGEMIVPNDTRTGLQDQQRKAAVIAAVEKGAEALTGALFRDRATPAAVQLVVLDQLLRKQPLPGIPKGDREALRVRLRKKKLFPTLSGTHRSLDELVALQRSGDLRLVDRDESHSPPGDARVWVPADEAMRRVLRAARLRDIPNGTGELRAWHKAARLRRTLPTVPPTPTGSWLAEWVGDRRDGRCYWIALTTAQQRATVIEWRVEERIITTEKRPSALPLRLRITDPALAPTPSFEKLQLGAALGHARDRVAQLIADFLLRLAEGVRLNGGTPDRTIREPEAVRWQLVAWAAEQDDLDPAWSDHHLLRCADGRTLGPLDLYAMAEEGPLRVVSPKTTGRTLDPLRPAIQCAGSLRRHLHGFGDLVDYTNDLRREEAAHVRRETPGIPQAAPSGALLTVPAPGGRDGYLQVDAKGTNAVTLHEQWRPLHTVSPRGAIPLVGKISDDALTPDAGHHRAIKDGAFHALMDDLEACSAEALPALLDVLDPRQHRRLILKIAARAFQGREAVAGARGAWGRLVDLPVLTRGDGTPTSLRAVAEQSGAPRWVPPGMVAPSRKPDQPFVHISPDELGIIGPVLGGKMSEAAAQREAQAIARRAAPAQPYALPEGSYAATEQLTVEGVRAKLGLSAELGWPGRLLIRCGGVPVEERRVNMLGLVGVVEVFESRVQSGWSRADLPRGFQRALTASHKALLDAGLPKLVGQGRIERALRGEGAAQLRQVPLVETSEGLRSLAALSDHDVLLMAQPGANPLREKVAAKRPPILSAERGFYQILAAAGLTERLELERRWLDARAAEEAREQAAKAARSLSRRTQALEHALKADLHRLLRGVLSTNKVNRALAALPLEQCPLYGEALGGQRAPRLLLAAWAADRMLAEEPDKLAVVLGRVARQLKG